MTTFSNSSHDSSETLPASRGAGRRNPPWSRCGPGISVLVMGLVGGTGVVGCSVDSRVTDSLSMGLVPTNSGQVLHPGGGEACLLLAYVPSVLPPGLRLRECEDGSVIYEFDFVMDVERAPAAGVMRADSFIDAGYPVFAMPEEEAYFGPPGPGQGITEFPGLLEGTFLGTVPGVRQGNGGEIGEVWNESRAQSTNILISQELTKSLKNPEFMSPEDTQDVGRGFELFMKTFAASCLFAVILIPSGCAYGAQRVAPCSRGSPGRGIVKRR